MTKPLPDQAHAAPMDRPRKAYQQPRLVRYGDVRLLTRSTTGSLWEGRNNGTGACKGPGGGGPGNYCTSDIQAKENIVRVGQHPWGFGLYLFDYRAPYRDSLGTARQFGVLAQEVELACPEAIAAGPFGLKAVNYDALGIRRGSH